MTFTRHRNFFVPGALAIWALMIAVSATLTGLLPGCAHSPLSAAKDVEQRAFAVYGSFVIVEEQAAKMSRDPSVPASVKQALRGADARAKPSADALLSALQAYQTGAAAIKGDAPGTGSGGTPDTAALQHAIDTAAGDVATLISAVKGAK